jgi:hypothetical protein
MKYIKFNTTEEFVKIQLHLFSIGYIWSSGKSDIYNSLKDITDKDTAVIKIDPESKTIFVTYFASNEKLISVNNFINSKLKFKLWF